MPAYHRAIPGNRAAVAVYHWWLSPGTLVPPVLLVIVFALLPAIAAASEAADKGTENATDGASLLRIKTTDTAGAPLAVDSVWWWFTASPQRRVQLACSTPPCSEWVLPLAALSAATPGAKAGGIRLNAYHGIPCPDDASCEQLFSGSLTLAAPVTAVAAPLRLPLTFASKACE